MFKDITYLVKEFLPHKKAILIIAISGALMSGAQARIVFYTKDLFDALENKNMDIIYTVPLYIIILALIAGICRYFHYFFANATADTITIKMRQDLQKKFMRLNLSFYNTYKSGSGGLLSRIMNDIHVIRFGLLLVADLFREPVLMICLVGWLFYINWQLTFGIFIVAPLMILFLKQISRSLRKYGRSSQEIMENLTSNIKETLDGVRVIQSFNLENEMENKFKSISNDFLRARKKIYARTEISGPVTEFLATLVVVTLFVYMMLLIVDEKASMGDFTSYIAALIGLQKPIKKLQESYVRIQETMVATRRLLSIVQDPQIVPESVSPLAFPTDWKTITYQNVSFSYGHETILENINLTLQRGEIIAFVGESGSGKSTLVNLLERFFDPTSGNILIDDIPINQFNLKELRSHIALVTQDVFLFSDTVEKNIWAGDFQKSRSNVIPSAKSANAHDFICKMPDHYQSSVGDRGGLISGGEKQRISIARAVFKDAPILILDEATSALDSVSELEVQKGLERLMKGRTALVIAHRLSTIVSADRIIVLKKGKILEIGSHQELIALNGEYSKFHSLQTSTL